MKIITRKAVVRLSVLAAAILLGLGFSWWFMIRMPGTSFAGPMPELSPEEAALRDELRRDVTKLAGEIGERNVTNAPVALAHAARWIEDELTATGLPVEVQRFEVRGATCGNVIAEMRGTSRPSDILVVGGHYDSVFGCPGANDNGTGAAATLALARRLAGAPLGRTVRFVLFTNEEPPHFQTDEMGSLVYARRCRERNEDVVGMISLETMGCYSDEDGSQDYPPPVGLFYPSKGNFIAFVGNWGSRKIVRRAIGTFREHARIPSEGGALPGFLPGISLSDHWSFWQAGYDGIMVTDTAPFRYAHYHRASDTPDRVDYARLSLVVSGLLPVVRDLASE